MTIPEFPTVENRPQRSQTRPGSNECNRDVTPTDNSRFGSASPLCDIGVMQYHEIFPMSRRDLEALIESGNESAITEALLSAAYYEPDWRWVQGVCLRFLDHTDKGVRSNAATCLGHIARIHRDLDVDLVLPKLLALKGDAAIGPWVEDALEDIRFFLRVE